MYVDKQCIDWVETDMLPTLTPEKLNTWTQTLSADELAEYVNNQLAQVEEVKALSKAEKQAAAKAKKEEKAAARKAAKEAAEAAGKKIVTSWFGGKHLPYPDMTVQQLRDL